MIHTPYIAMHQLLKWIGAAENGAVAKEMCRLGEVLVNGKIETAPGKKIVPGDVLEIDGVKYLVEQE